MQKFAKTNKKTLAPLRTPSQHACRRCCRREFGYVLLSMVMCNLCFGPSLWLPRSGLWMDQRKLSDLRQLSLVKAPLSRIFALSGRLRGSNKFQRRFICLQKCCIECIKYGICKVVIKNESFVIHKGWFINVGLLGKNQFYYE